MRALAESGNDITAGDAHVQEGEPEKQEEIEIVEEPVEQEENPEEPTEE